ncbi:SusC/RagA family TonB-linked outer membrane protein [Flavivirga abyssicola]|uniref:SusC/RagA family TonB-linked outer membrane protein n=1 Tax=Flavivirga abyssicola TaxID=3063533 RepID=UPI0026E05ACE|nr:SusC/RagA family TonB-linked outer membrane protein [Flavivirga sp. MEBiC07777]WVK11651.1 SusC/RagA family TonB-linked outer membrane protein [Flavivirga sp. MEBiC07777]
MKKNSERGDFQSRRIRNILRIMKISVFLFFITVTSVFANDSYSQNKKMTLNMTNVKLGEVLDAIEENSKFYFLINQELIDEDKIVSIHVKNTKISNILNALVNTKQIDYVIRDKQIVFTKREYKKVEGIINQGVSGNGSTINLETPLLNLKAYQTSTIKGVVTDASGVPLPGVNIIVKGTTVGSQTNFDGNYSLDVPLNSKTLVFSYLGFATQEILIENKTTVNVVMLEDATALSEIVVVGYGSQNKQEVTGAVAVADLETYNAVPVNNVLDMVKGTVPGLNISGINSAGEVPEFTIRGANTIAGSAAPLLVVDGVIFPGSLGDIRNSDIATFTTLKDASAAAIYGARSANGVILIETKKGKGKENGKPSFSLNVNTTTSNELEPLRMHNAEGYLQNVLDIRAANDLEADPAKIAQYLEEVERENYSATPNHTPTLTNPYDIGTQSASLRSFDFSVQNRTDKSNYFVSVGMTDQKGIILNDNFKQLSLRINHNSELTDWLDLGITSFYTFRDTSGSEPDIRRAARLSPYASVYDDSGIPVRYPQTTTSLPSPLWSIAREHSRLGHNLRASANLIFNIPWVKGLKFKSVLSHNKRWNEARTFFDNLSNEGIDDNGVGERIFDRSDYRLFDNILTYNRVFAEKHKIGLTLLYSQENTEFEGITATGRDYSNQGLGSYGLSDAAIQKTEGRGGESKALGTMARFNYTFSNKYSFTGTFRRDGYSAFAANKKWANFASAGANWNLGAEEFMKNVEPISHLNMSLSYGSVGNRSISPYQTLASIGTGKYIYGDNTSFVVTQAINRFANPNLSWEKTTGFNGGLGFGLFNERISGRFDWYSNSTTDLLFNVPLTKISGGPDDIVSNLGELENKGIEISLRSVNIKNENFEWTSSFNFSRNRNKVKTIFGKDGDGDGIEDDLLDALNGDGVFIGRDLGTIYDYKVLGLWQQEDVDNGTIQAGMRPGDYRTEDVADENGVFDGVITSDNDRQILGTTQENFRWSLTNVFSYKKFTLMAYIYSIWGGNGYYLSGNNTPQDEFGANRTDINHPIYDYWTPTNTGARYPRPDYKERAAYNESKEYFDRSFIKLQRMALSYDFSEIVKPFGIYGMSVTFSANNLFTYAPHWEGLDPETNQGLSDTARPSIRDYSLSVLFNF